MGDDIFGDNPRLRHRLISSSCIWLGYGLGRFFRLDTRLRRIFRTQFVSPSAHRTILGLGFVGGGARLTNCPRRE